MRNEIRTVECNSGRFQHFPVLFLTVEKITDFSKKRENEISSSSWSGSRILRYSAANALRSPVKNLKGASDG